MSVALARHVTSMPKVLTTCALWWRLFDWRHIRVARAIHKARTKGWTCRGEELRRMEVAKHYQITCLMFEHLRFSYQWSRQYSRLKTRCFLQCKGSMDEWLNRKLWMNIRHMSDWDVADFFINISLFVLSTPNTTYKLFARKKKNRGA